MMILFVVLPLAVCLSALAAAAFLWATRTGQFDDLETPAVRLLCDELRERAPESHPPNGGGTPRNSCVDATSDCPNGATIAPALEPVPSKLL